MAARQQPHRPHRAVSPQVAKRLGRVFYMASLPVALPLQPPTARAPERELSSGEQPLSPALAPSPYGGGAPPGQPRLTQAREWNHDSAPRACGPLPVSVLSWCQTQAFSASHSQAKATPPTAYPLFVWMQKTILNTTFSFHRLWG